MINHLSPSLFSFGTDGVRGNAELFPFISQALYPLGRALARWASEKYETPQPIILLGCDTRISCERIKQALCHGLVAGGAQVFDGGVIPTPAVCQLVKSESQFNAGIVISASHNPYYDNGIKVFDSKRLKLSKDDERIIEQYAQQFLDHPLPVLSDITLTQQWPEAGKRYVENIVAQFSANQFAGMKIVLDCAHGATSGLAQQLFTMLGAEVITIFAQPNGTNINDHCGANYPIALAQAVVEHQALCGFAFDGDGDRVTGVNRYGAVRNGDDILWLVTTLAEFSDITAVVGTVMTNQGLELALADRGIKLLRTAVGDKYVSAALDEHNLALGGEISGHTIVRGYQASSDGLFVALKVLEAMIQNNNFDMQTFTKYPQVLLNIKINQKKDLSQPPFVTLINEYENLLKNGRLLVRYSGTEKLLRIMTEAEDEMLALQVANDLALLLETMLG
jgi:phosphoglucosamine mutase